MWIHVYCFSGSEGHYQDMGCMDFALLYMEVTTKTWAAWILLYYIWRSLPRHGLHGFCFTIYEGHYQDMGCMDFALLSMKVTTKTWARWILD